MSGQAEKGKAFRALHERPGAFIIPNPWDAGTARLLAQLGFEALATTSAGYAFSAGQRDNTIGRDRIAREDDRARAVRPEIPRRVLRPPGRQRPNCIDPDPRDLGDELLGTDGVGHGHERA